MELDPALMEDHNVRRQERYRLVEATEARYQEFMCEDAEYLIVAFGSAARICQKSVELLRQEGIKAGLLRPITLWPFPTQAIQHYTKQVKSMLCAELNAGQMVQDVRLAVNGQVPVEHFGRMGGMVPTPEEIVEALKKQM